MASWEAGGYNRRVGGQSAEIDFRPGGEKLDGRACGAVWWAAEGRMMGAGEWFLAVVGICLLSGIAGAVAAYGRNAAGRGFLAGLCLGPLGVVAALGLDGRPQCLRCGGRLDGACEVCPHCGARLVGRAAPGEGPAGDGPVPQGVAIEEDSGDRWQELAAGMAATRRPPRRGLR